MSFKSIVFFAALLVVASFSSCNRDADPPVISNTEIGENNSLTATIGGELHMDAEIVADGKIDKITVDLHLEGGTEEDEIEAEYTTDYEGLKNVDFHEDLEIPAGTTPGEYHFHLTVIDQEGQTTDFEADVDIQ